MQKVRVLANILICAKPEDEDQLPAAKRQEYLASIGLHETGLQRFLRASFDMVGVDEMETHAWTFN